MCPNCKNESAKVIKKGFFTKKKKRKVQRYYCHSCRKTFSDQTTKPSYRLRKWQRRNEIFGWICSGVSQRQMARRMKIHPQTVARYLPIFARIATEQNSRTCRQSSVSTIVLDEMETFEHTKCKPISIVIAVEESQRTVLAAEACSMPAKGRLASISRKRYGPRVDHRAETLERTLESFRVNKNLETIKSDQCPRYLKPIRQILPGVTHKAYKGRRARDVGQGELKRGGFDPLFSLNHSCASFRDLIKTLSRRTWCTAKLTERLQMLLQIFAHYFNQMRRGIKWARID